VQDYILFTYDDVNAGQSAEGTDGNGIVSPPNRIRMIRDNHYKYARYFDGEGNADQQEFYDVRPASLGGTDTDPLTGNPVELRNLSNWAEAHRTLKGEPTLATASQQQKRAEMMHRLEQIVGERLQSRPYESPVKGEDVTVRTVTAVADGANEPQDMIEIKFLSRWGTDYQLQRSTGLETWTDVGKPVQGNNGQILLCEPLTDDSAFYRVIASAE